MKRLFYLLAAAAFTACGSATTLSVMTFNMRYDNPEDGADNWRFRRERIAGLIRSEAVDLLGTQEVLANQFDDLQALLPGYRAVGVGREDGARAGEFNAVFFRSDRFELLDSGVFWLSEEPETPGSKGWDGACERLATWTVLRDKSGRELLFINTHLDHVGEQARREGVALLLRRIETLRDGRPVILTGEPLRFDWRPMIRAMAEDVEKGLDKGRIASRFMNTLISMAVAQCAAAGERSGLRDVVLSGGSFQNMYIMERLPNRLKEQGFRVWHHHRVSANDEGISLGQLMIAQKSAEKE